MSVDVGAAGAGHGGAEFGSDESVDGGEEDAGMPDIGALREVEAGPPEFAKLELFMRQAKKNDRSWTKRPTIDHY
ncbi:hypothetical protein [Nocardia sp. NPDC004722]